MPIRKIRRNRLPEVVAEQLAAAVRTGEFKEGQKFPPERELSERFGVSRNVVREAANTLRSRGLLVTRHGSGSVVSNRLHKPVSDLLDLVLGGQAAGERKLLELRSVIEVDAARLAAERATGADIKALACVLDTYDRGAEDLDSCAELDVAFHRALAQAAHNELFGIILASLDELLVRTRRAALARSGFQVASRSHREILKAVTSRQPDAAAKAMDRHLSEATDRLSGAGSRWGGGKGKGKA